MIVALPRIAPPESLLTDVVADPRPPARLLARLRELDAEAGASLGCALFESLHYRLPAFADDDLPLVASRLYARAGRTDPARLLAGLAAQLHPRDPAAEAGTRAVPTTEDIAKADEIVRQHEPGQMLLLALEALDHETGWPRCAALFESVWPRARPMAQYWVYHRMANVYAALGRTDAAVLLSTLAIQIEPSDPASDIPYRRLLAFFTHAERWRDAADLVARRAALCPEPPLLDPPAREALLAKAGELLPSPPPAGRLDRSIMPAEPKEARSWRVYGAGVPLGLRPLQQDMQRDPIRVAALTDAEVLIDNGAVAVFGPDGAPHIDLSLRCFPALLRRDFARAAADQIEIDEAVLISDEFPSANLCHFLLDHATRLDVYRRAGVEVGDVTVIGPELREVYQRETAARMGARDYFPISRRARLRIGRLHVSSNCHTLRHPAHWGATWAVGAIREKFDLTPRDRSRRLMISRSDSNFRRIANEADIQELLDFDLIVPGKLSFAEQIAAFRDATHIVAPHGAGLTNVLWCAPGTHVLEVFHPHYGTWAYAMLKDALRLDYSTLVARDAESDAAKFNDTSLTREQMEGGASRDMWVDPTELRRWLADCDAL